MIFRWFLVIFLSLSAGVGYASGNSKQNELKLKNLIPLLLEVNPEIKSAQKEWKAYENLPPVVSSLPDPLVSVGVRNEGWDLGLKNEMMSSIGINFAQSIPFPLKLKRRGDQFRSLAQAKKAEYEAVTLRILREFKSTFYQYWYLFRKEKLISEMIDAMADLYESASSLYKTGKGSLENVLRVQVEKSRLEEKLVRIGIEKEKVRWKIASYLNMSEKDLKGKPVLEKWVEKSFSLEELLDFAIERNPQIKKMKEMVETQEKNLSVKKLEYAPDFFLSGGVFLRSPFKEIWEVRAGIDLPLYFWRKQMKEVAKARLMLKSTVSDLDGVVQRVISGIKATLRSFDDNLKLIKLYRKSIVPQALNTYKTASSLYAVGKVGFLNMLEDLIALYSYRIDEAQVTANYLTDLAVLEELTGGKLIDLTKEGKNE